MSKKQEFNIICFGDELAVTKFTEYLGFTERSGSGGMTYFEFPNTKFANKKFKKLFKFKLKIYVCRPQLLNTLISPKQQFKIADAIVVLFDNQLDSLFKICIEYFEKFALTRKSFVPMLFIGGNQISDKDKRSIERFSLNLEVTNIFNDIFGIETHYLDITENHNEALFFVRIQELIKSIIKNPSTKNYTKITVERMVHTLKDKIKSFEETSQTLERCIALLGDIEQDKSITISRYTLVNSWGLQNILAQKLMNFWENRIYIEDIEDEEIPILENDALLKYKKCMKLKLEPNLINFLTLGFNFQESKKILSILKKIGKIDTISYHLPSTDYKTYDNLQDMVIISKGRTIYIRSRTSTHDQVTMFSGLIQTIEIVRNNYMSDKTAGIQDWFQFEKVDFLDFGNLHAILGNGDNENKVILRFRERPQKLYIEKTTAFIKEFEKIFAEILTNRIINVKEIRPEITKLFYIHFNPFPQKAAFDKIIGLIDKEIEKSELWDLLTDMEKNVVELILKSHNLKINAILSNFAEKNLNNISESDILQIVFDLINEKILG